MKPESALFMSRAYVTLTRIKMKSLKEFCEHGHDFFDRRVRKFEKEIEKSIGDDMDWAVDVRAEMLTHVGYNSYFGILMAFAAFEQYLGYVHDLTFHIGTHEAVRDALMHRKQPFMKLEDHKEFLSKLGIVLTKPPFQWQELIKLQAYRNAIAHQGGLVNDQNEKRMKAYGYRSGDYVEVKIEEVLRFIQLVQDSAEQITEQYARILYGKKMIVRKNVGRVVKK